MPGQGSDISRTETPWNPDGRWRRPGG